MNNFDTRPRKVHLYKNQRGRPFKNQRGKVDNTLCAGNHGEGILTTTDRSKVTCRRCLRFMEEAMAKPAIKTQEERMRELRFDTMKAELEDLRAEQLKLSERNGSQETSIRNLLSDNKEFREENNDLRARLMASELAYAKLRGYLEGIRDSQPPVMVPQQREPFHAQMTDGSFGTSSLDWRQDGSGRATKHWYQR